MALTMCVCSGRFRLKGLQAICQAVSHFLHALPLLSNRMPEHGHDRGKAVPPTQHYTLLPILVSHTAVKIKGMTQQKLN